MKLFIHEILPDDVPKAIYIDTDAFFMTDPTLLWERFASMDPSVAISMPTHYDQYTPHWHHASKICSCIMLLDLEKLRNMRLMDSSYYRQDTTGLFPQALSPPTFEAMFGPPGPDGHYRNVALGDQGYYWAIVSNRPEIFEHLPLDWEFSSCLQDMYGTGLGEDDTTEDEEREIMLHLEGTPHENKIVIPKLVHLYVDTKIPWRHSVLSTALTRSLTVIACTTRTSTTNGMAGAIQRAFLPRDGDLPWTPMSEANGSG